MRGGVLRDVTIWRQAQRDLGHYETLELIAQYLDDIGRNCVVFCDIGAKLQFYNFMRIQVKYVVFSEIMKIPGYSGVIVEFWKTASTAVNHCPCLIVTWHKPANHSTLDSYVTRTNLSQSSGNNAWKFRYPRHQPRTLVNHGFLPKNQVRPSTAVNKGLTDHIEILASSHIVVPVRSEWWHPISVTHSYQ